MVRRGLVVAIGVRRIKKRAGRETEEVEEEAVHQNIQPKEEPQEIGETEQGTRVIHPFSNRNNAKGIKQN